MATDQSKNAFQIKETDLKDPRSKSVGYITAVSYTPSKLADQNTNTINAVVNMALAVRSQSNDKVSLQNTIKILRDKFMANTLLIPIKLNIALMAIQEGLAVALYIKGEYEKASNLTTLLQKKEKSGKLVGDEAAEFDAKQETATAITHFVWAAYVVHALTNEASSTGFAKFDKIPEISKLQPVPGISSIVYYLDAFLKYEGMISVEQDTIDFTFAYFSYLLRDVIQRKENFKYASFYTETNYTLENSEFELSGWEEMQHSKAKSVEFNKVSFESIVGNREAKHLSMRTIGAMLSYDFKLHKNPFDEIAKYARFTEGDGFPGTGKSLIIAATATKIQELCDWLGYSFLFVPFPDNIVSTYQGGSAERTIEWFKAQQDPNKIIYAPIDDAENNLMNRAEQGVSAGVKEVIGVLLRWTEGAYSVDHGNRLIAIYTNMPEKIDPAVMSRVQRKAAIRGAVTHNDFLDQNYLWLNKYGESLKGIVELGAPNGYTYMDDQKVLTSVSSLNQKPEDLITHPAMLKLYQDTIKKYPNTEGADFYAALAYGMQQISPYFTSREARNIQTNIDTRLCDFDFPDEWWKDPKIYFHQPYEVKVQMLREQMKIYMKGQSFAQIMLQETLKYMDNFIRINLTEEDRKIQRYVDDMIFREKAQEEYKRRTGKTS